MDEHSRRFWQSIATDVQAQYRILDIPCHEWEMGEVKLFLGHMDAKVRSFCMKNGKIAELCENEDGKTYTYSISYPTFRRIFIKGSSSGNLQSRTLFCIYLGYDSYTSYLSKKNIQVTRSQKDNTEQPRPLKTLTTLIRKHYLSHPIFTEIPILGGDVVGIGGLPMRHFFSNLSHLPVSTIRKAESLIGLEKQNQTQREILVKRYRSGGHIGIEQISGHEHAIILGNPGIGKSTFVRWVCHSWAKGDAALRGTPMYIELKELSEKDFPSSLLSWVAERHGISLPPTNDGDNNILFILDGFDEMQESVRRKLIRHLSEHSNISFILASRPYALSGHEIDASAILEITGFDENNKIQFTEHIMGQKAGLGSRTDHFISIIANSPLLYDYSHNPLMLSYLLLIYLSSDNPEDSLLHIDSRFSLQHSVIQCLRYYFMSKKLRDDSESYFSNQIDKGSGLALWMEDANKFAVYADYPAISRFGGLELLKGINYIGLGRMDEVRHPFPRQLFQFVTLSIQEYLAANRMADSDNAGERISDMLSSPLDWNLLRMLIGRLSLDNNLKALDNAWNTIRSEWENQPPNVYRLYRVVLFFSELSPSLSSNILSESLIDKLLSEYIQASVARSQWNGMLNDVLPVLIAKSSHINHSHFVAAFNKLLVCNTEDLCKMQGQDSYMKLTGVIELALVSRLCNEIVILKYSSRMLGLLVSTFGEKWEIIQEVTQSVMEGNETDEYMGKILELANDIGNTVSEILRLFVNCDLEYLEQFRNEIVELQSFIPEGSSLWEFTHYEFSEVHLRLRNTKEIISEFKKLVELDEESFLGETTLYSISSVASIMTPNYPEDFLMDIFNESCRLIEKVRGYNISEDYMDTFTNSLCQILGHMGTKYSLTRMLSEIDSSPPFDMIHVSAPASLLSRCLGFSYTTTTPIIHCTKMLWKLHSTSKGLVLFLKHRDYWIEQFVDITVRHQEALDKDFDEILDSNEDDFSYVTPTAVRSFFEIFHIIVEDFRFPQKGYFFDRICASPAYTSKSIRHQVLLDLVGDGIFLSLGEYFWNYLGDIIQSDIELDRIPSILAIEELYALKSDLDKLIYPWTYLSNNLSRIDTNLLPDVFSCIHQLLQSLKTTGSSRMMPYQSKLLGIATNLLEKEELREQIYVISSEDSGMVSIATYALLSYLNPEMRNTDLISDETLYNGLDMDGFKVLVSNSFNKEELELIKDVFPSSVYVELREFLLFYSIDG